MLGKLLKYDFKAMLKTIVPLWIVAIVASVSFSIFNKMDIKSDLANTTFLVVLFGVFVAIVVINIMLIIQRFWNGLLKEEGYLMFTIPTSPRKLIISKAISATVISTITTIVAFICVMIIATLFMIDYNENVLVDMIMAIGNRSGKEIFSIILFLVVTLIGSIQKIYVFYAAMALGQLSNKNRFLSSVGFFLVINIVISMVSSTMASIFGMNTTFVFSATEDIFTLDSFNAIMGISGILCIILIIILHGMTEWTLTKRLNLE